MKEINTVKKWPWPSSPLEKEINALFKTQIAPMILLESLHVFNFTVLKSLLNDNINYKYLFEFFLHSTKNTSGISELLRLVIIITVVQ